MYYHDYLFTAFADTAQYLYDHIAPFMLANFGLHTALVTGQIDSRTTLKTKTKLDFNTTLTLFSPRSNLNFPGESALKP